MATLTAVTPGAAPTSGTLVAPKVVSAAATDTVAFGRNLNASSLVLVIDITSFTSGTLTVTIQGITPSGVTYTILASSALGAAAVTTLSVGPALPATANVSANAVLGDQIQVSLAYATTPSFTYKIEYLMGVQ